MRRRSPCVELALVQSLPSSRSQKAQSLSMKQEEKQRKWRTDRQKKRRHGQRERERGGDIDINQKEEFLQPCTARGGSCRKDILN